MQRRSWAVLLLLGAAVPALAQSSNSTNAPPPPQHRMAFPAPPRAAADMQAVLDQHAALGAKPIETLTPVKARLQPSAADAAHAVMRRQGQSTAPPPAVRPSRRGRRRLRDMSSPPPVARSPSG